MLENILGGRSDKNISFFRPMRIAIKKEILCVTHIGKQISRFPRPKVRLEKDAILG